MERYEKYKASTISGLEEIPVHWNEIRMRYIGFLYGGLSGKSASDFNKLNDANNKTFIPFTNIASNVKVDSTSLQNVVVHDNEKQNEVKNGDLFFLMSSENYDDVGLSSVLCEDLEKTFLNSFCKGFRVTSSEVLPIFLNYQLRSKELRHNLLVGANGFTRINLKIDKVNDLKTALPPLSEQTAIANYLDRKTAEIDALIAKKKRLLELYEEEKTAIINHAVTKGINPDAPMKDSGIPWLGEVPESWEVKKLKHIIKKLESGVSVNSVDRPIIGDEFGILKTSCVYDYSFRSNENKAIVSEYELKRAKVNPRMGSIIISRMNTPELVGASGYVEKNYPNLFLPDRLWQTIFYDDALLNSRWLAFIFESISFRQLISQIATGTSPSMKNIGQSDFLNIEIPYPSVKEQDKIQKTILESIQKIEYETMKAKRQMKLMIEYRTAIISEVVTGKVKVHEGFHGE